VVENGVDLDSAPTTRFLPHHLASFFSRARARQTPQTQKNNNLHWQAVYGRYTLDRLLLPKDESHYWMYSSMLNTSIPAKITSSAAADGKSVRAYAADDGTKGTIKLDHLLGRMSAEPILSRELCAKVK